MRGAPGLSVSGCDHTDDLFAGLYIRPAFAASIAPEGKSEEKALVKMADKISAYLKCLEETKAGNTEFRLAMEGKYEELSHMENEELQYFMKNILPVYSKSLDELQIAVDIS